MLAPPPVAAAGAFVAAFEVPGEPRGKGRPRFVRATGRTYTPEPTVSYESLIRVVAAQAMAGRPPVERCRPLICRVAAGFPVPASWSARKRSQAFDGSTWPTKKPDGDNILKILGDALNGVVWSDDAQVVSWFLQKQYSNRPSLAVVVEAM